MMSTYSASFQQSAEALDRLIDSVLGRPYLPKGATLEEGGFYCLGFALWCLKESFGIEFGDVLKDPSAMRAFKSDFIQLGKEEALQAGDLLLTEPAESDFGKQVEQHIGIVCSPGWVADADSFSQSVGRTRLLFWQRFNFKAYRHKSFPR